MNTILPVDSRATTTLHRLLEPLFVSVNNATTKKQITDAILNHLPFGLASSLELHMAIQDRNQRFTIDQRKEFVRNHAITLLEQAITRGTRFKTYMREDVVRWYNWSPHNLRYFTALDDEIITITLTYPNRVRRQQLQLSQDQLIGIAYGLHSLRNQVQPQVEVISSITNGPIEFDRIVENALVYRLPHEDATERLKRPYRVETIQSDGHVLPVYFIHPEFMQGLLSVASWYQLPNKGEGSLWQNLTQFTREGEIALRV
jgi:hypothetical protein